jgi:N-acetylated-alpha-linked acidic dipeptidase
LIGSTEWAEDHAVELKNKAVAYLNTDGYSRGFVSIGGSHTLERFFNQIMDEVNDPVFNVSVKQRHRAADRLNAKTDQEKEDANKRADLRIYPMGSGSDYTPFLQHLGIASANLGFGGEGEDGSYHTLYDTYEHFIQFQDPGMLYGAALAKLAGRATLRLANAARLPFEFTGFADNVFLYLTELEELADKQRETTEETRQLVEQGVYAIALDPNKTLGPPMVEAAVPYFNFAPLQNAVKRLELAAAAFDQLSKQAIASEKVNEQLYTTERLLTRAEGLQGRDWFKHFIYAPGFYTGYGVKTIPGVRESIEQREYAKVDAEIVIAAEVLDGLTARIMNVVEQLQE